MKAKVGIIGLWHLGSVYSACLAELGHEVISVDNHADNIKALNTGKAPLFEPGLDNLIKKNLKKGNLAFTTDIGAMIDRDFIFITYDTPVDKNDKSDLSEIRSTIKKIATIKKSPVTIVISSQLPVGTCRQFEKLIKGINRQIKFDIVYLPENLRLGNAIDCFLKADRFVVGANNDRAFKKIEQLLQKTGAPLLTMSLESAETAKHALNSFLATCISFTNELANFCELVDANIIDVTDALKTDSRIGKKAYLNAGLGFAGGTLARDLVAIISKSKKAGMKLPVIEGVLQTNASRSDQAITKLLKILGQDTRATVGVLGLTYKPGTSTLRRSIALEVIKKLHKIGLTVKAYDPKADLNEIKEQRDFILAKSPEEMAQDSSAILVLTGWPEFKELDYKKMSKLMKKPIILDLINFTSEEKYVKFGYSYYGTGKGGVTNETGK